MKRWVAVCLVLFVPVALATLGIVSNQAVLWANGGYMPVAAPEGCTVRIPDWNHTCMTVHTHLKFLGDWIVGNGGISSIGDFLQDLSEQLKIPAILTWLGLLIGVIMEKR